MQNAKENRYLFHLKTEMEKCTWKRNREKEKRLFIFFSNFAYPSHASSEIILTRGIYGEFIKLDFQPC